MRNTKKYAFITGANGQDASFLAELLLEKGYKVFGSLRRNSVINTERIEHIRKELTLYYMDLCDMASILSVLSKIKNEIGNNMIEIYHLAAQSHVSISFQMPLYTTQVISIGIINLLESIKILQMIKQTKFYNASTSEMFGGQENESYDEQSPFNPRSPYAIAKMSAHYTTKNYRDAYGMFACSGILFNHESERRGFNFVTRKITLELSKIVRGKTRFMELGNLDSKRDWGHSKDYCRAMWLMLQQPHPEDFVIGTGKQHSVRDFVNKAFNIVNKEIVWSGFGLNEVGKLKSTGQVVVRVNPKYYRPAEVDNLLADATHAYINLKWKPKISFDEMVRIMVNNDLLVN